MIFLSLPLWAVDLLRIGAWGDDNMVMVGLLFIAGFMAWQTHIFDKISFIILLYIVFVMVLHGFSFLAVFGQPQINDGMAKYLALLVAINYFMEHRPKNMALVAVMLGFVIFWQAVSVFLPTFHWFKLTQYDEYLGFVGMALMAIFPHILALLGGVLLILLSHNLSALLAIIGAGVFSLILWRRHRLYYGILCLVIFITMPVVIMAVQYIYQPQQMGDATWQYSLWSRAMALELTFTQTNDLLSQITGHGFGQFGSFVQQYYPLFEAYLQQPLWDALANNITNPHNIFADMYFTGGVVGLILWFVWGAYYVGRVNGLFQAIFFMGLLVLAGFWFIVPQLIPILALALVMGLKGAQNLSVHDNGLVIIFNKILAGILWLLAIWFLLAILHIDFMVFDWLALPADSPYIVNKSQFMAKFPDEAAPINAIFNFN